MSYGHRLSLMSNRVTACARPRCGPTLAGGGGAVPPHHPVGARPRHHARDERLALRGQLVAVVALEPTLGAVLVGRNAARRVTVLLGRRRGARQHCKRTAATTSPPATRPRRRRRHPRQRGLGGDDVTPGNAASAAMTSPPATRPRRR